MKAIDYSDKKGRKFGYLTFDGVFKRKAKRGERLWAATCVCGKTIWHPFATYKAGKCKSCGCKKGRIEKSLASKRRVYDAYKRNAKTRNLSFKLDFDIFIKLVIKECYYCGDSKTSIKTGPNGNFSYTGIDRSDSNIGYVESNCVSCCKICNQMKWAMSEKEFLKLVSSIYINKIQV